MLRTTFALVALCLGLSFVAAQPPAPAVTMDDIKKAWQDRQDKVKTLKIDWTSTTLIRKGQYSQGAGSSGGSAVPHPPRDMFVKSKTSVALDTDKLRIHEHRQQWFSEKNAFLDSESITIRDNINRLLYSPVVANQAFPSANISLVNDSFVDLSRVEMYPVLWYSRGADPRLARVSLDSYDVSGVSPSFGGVSCVEIVRKSTSSGSVASLWLDRKNGYLPVRYFTIHNKKLSVDMSVSYESQKSGHAIPSKWKYAMAPNGKFLGESLECAVDFTEINARMNEDLFSPKFAPGTVVTDLRPGTQSRHIIDDDGNSGRQHSLRQNVTHRELVEEAHEDHRSSRKLTTVVAAALAIASMIWVTVRLLWYRRRHSQSIPSSAPQQEDRA